VEEEDARKLVRALLTGLEYLHSNNIIHRDIKLENVLIAQDHFGNPASVLSDFGLA
jgi:serine/threonine protein kinase